MDATTYIVVVVRLLVWCDVAAPRVKPTAVHDTHGQFTKLPKLTPAELSRMKAEKEARDAQELLMRRRNDEITRQHLLREQAQRAQGQAMPQNAVRYHWDGVVDCPTYLSGYPTAAASNPSGTNASSRC